MGSNYIIAFNKDHMQAVATVSYELNIFTGPRLTHEKKRWTKISWQLISRISFFSRPPINSELTSITLRRERIIVTSTIAGKRKKEAPNIQKSLC